MNLLLPKCVVVSLLLLAASTGCRTAKPGAYDIRAFGAKADGKTKCTAAIRKAIETATAHGGGTIYVPAGSFLTGPIHLESHITLYLDAGAVLKFSTNFDDYYSRWQRPRPRLIAPSA